MTDDLPTLKSRAEKAQRDQMRVEAEREAAQADVEKSLDDLEKSYGVRSLGEAKKLAVEKRAEMDAAAAKLEKALEDLS